MTQTNPETIVKSGATAKWGPDGSVTATHSGEKKDMYKEFEFCHEMEGKKQWVTCVAIELDKEAVDRGERSYAVTYSC
jgi:hypothetical protein